MSIVTLVCSGQMASALTFPLIENGHEVRLVGSPLDDEIIERLREDNYHTTLRRTLHEGIKYYNVTQLDEALEGTDLVVGGVSSFGIDWFAENVLSAIPEGVPMISVTKGLYDYEDGTMDNYLEYWEKNMPEGATVDLYAIGGPCTARDLADHDPSFVAFCGDDLEKLEWIKSLFSTDYYVISLTKDTIGLEGAVALKNGYALGTALAIGLKEKAGDDGVAHNNSKAALFQQSIKEILLLLDIIGGGLDNIMYAAGDLDVTVSAGRSRTVGLLLGKGYTVEEVEKEMAGETLEAIVIATRTARAVRALAEAGKVNLEDFPLLMHVDSLLNQGEVEGETTSIPWNAFETVS